MQGVGFGSSSESDTFMQLLVARLRHQDPLEPASDAEFVQQLTQFSMLDAINGLRTDLQSSLRGQELASAQQFLGRHVEARTSAGAVSGIVEGVETSGNGILLNVDGRLIQLAEVSKVAM